MKNYNSIDLTKFILSIFVITIHCYIVPTIQQPLLRDICMMIQYTAVPLFFCFTGYFLFRRVLLAPEGAKKNIKRAWLRFGKLYLIWFIIYSVIIDGQGGGGVWGGGVVNILHNLFCRGYNHLWYLWSGLYCIPIIYLLLKIKIKPTAIFIIGIIAYIFFRVYSHYGSVDNPQGICRLFAYIWEHHLFNVFGICNGLCYLSMGLLFAQKGTTKNKRWLFTLFILGILLSIPDRNRTLGIGMILITYVACNLILNWNLKMNKNIAMQFREASTFIYVVHGATIALTSKWLSVNQLNGWIACVLFTVFSAFLFIKLKEQKGFSWLKQLI